MGPTIDSYISPPAHSRGSIVCVNEVFTTASRRTRVHHNPRAPMNATVPRHVNCAQMWHNPRAHRSITQVPKARLTELPGGFASDSPLRLSPNPTLQEHDCPCQYPAEAPVVQSRSGCARPIWKVSLYLNEIERAAAASTRSGRLLVKTIPLTHPNALHHVRCVRIAAMHFEVL